MSDPALPHADVRPRHPYRLPEDRRPKYARARRLEWWTLGWLASIIAVIYWAMGSSAAMQAAWIEDLLSLVPPIAFLWASRFEFRAPNDRFPFGYLRSMQIAYLGASVALLMLGGYLVVDALLTLAQGERPTIGATLPLGGWLFDDPIWAGWVMIAALIYSVIPPMILGRMKLKLADELHDDVLACDAKMNKADWMTGLAGAFGVLGVGYGWWWADAVAAGLIGLDVTRDGARGTAQVVADLMDHVPTGVGDRSADPLPGELREQLLALDWVEDVEFRLREQGRAVTGTIFVSPKADAVTTAEDLMNRLREAERLAETTHWRLYDLDVRPVRQLKTAVDRRAEPPG
ncbi:cation transporter [Alienimonas californiensis]|uniref:Cation efflux family protein n=1 Tax=Alienimonas californiensis TaxID=2527989 RepID=A0A517P6B6_9PLAN|nr:cation transporter [Alienimonas californiensis]QDT14914.1 Cation efflux family protein [Alienimonas californiensis]